MSRNDGRDVVAALFGLGFGVWHFYKGFERLKLRRRIEGLATSKVRSMAMGTVELSGRAQRAAELFDPIYKEPCALYRVEVEERRGSGKNRRWVSVYSADSCAHPFFLEDETGRVPVFPAGAELLVSRDVDGRSGFFSNGDPAVTRFLEGLGAGGFFGKELRVRADIIRPDDPVHVVGYAVPADDPLRLSEKVSRALKAPLHELARRLKADAARMRRIDLDGDGRLSAFEWDIGLEAYRREHEQAAPAEPPASGALVRADPEGFLFISDKHEEDCLGELGWRASLGIFGGPALALACAAYLAARLGLLPGSF